MTATGIGFDARLIGALGIGRYISGLLPKLALILGERLTVVANRKDAAIVRALIGGLPHLMTVNAQPYRLAEQSLLPLSLLRAELGLIHFPHYNLPLVKPGHFVVTVHDLFPFQFPQIHSGLLPRAVNQMLMCNAVRRADRIITPSKATAQAVKQSFPGSADRVLAIPEAADDRFNALRNPEGEAAWQTRLNIRPPYVFYLGQWKAYKNLPLLLEAFQIVRRTHPASQLVLAGDDPRHPEVRQLAAELPEGSIVLPGRLPESAVPDLYRGAAVVVLPSQAEGFGLPVGQAMAAGVPVLTSNVSSLPEVVGDAGLLADPGEQNAQVGEHLGDSAHCGARAAGGSLLFNGDGGDGAWYSPNRPGAGRTPGPPSGPGSSGRTLATSFPRNRCHTWRDQRTPRRREDR